MVWFDFNHSAIFFHNIFLFDLSHLNMRIRRNIWSSSNFHIRIRWNRLSSHFIWITSITWSCFIIDIASQNIRWSSRVSSVRRWSLLISHCLRSALNINRRSVSHMFAGCISHSLRLTLNINRRAISNMFSCCICHWIISVSDRRSIGNVYVLIIIGIISLFDFRSWLGNKSGLRIHIRWNISISILSDFNFSSLRISFKSYSIR
jgi:hypothetical protein